ncbi:MAG TPA: hypothetical protein EYG74_00745 [Sulfurimonas autotrophica]|nr:hypothetical protein [Sulfurimonas autotrophica]
MKKNYKIVQKTAIGVLLTLMSTMFSGCGDSTLEKEKIESLKIENSVLKSEINKVRSNNNLLISKINDIKSNNKNFKQEISTLRDNNKGLNISLAKSELLFSKKHKLELETERKKIENEKNAFKKEKIKIEIKAYKNAENTVKNKYFGMFIILSILLILLVLFGFFRLKTKNQELAESQKEKDTLESDKKVLIDEKSSLEASLISLSNNIKDLQRKYKEGAKNQVINKIEEAESKRLQLMHQIEEN